MSRRAEGQSPATCADCGVEPGQPHVDGCDVARCTECGWQRIGCEHEDSDIGWGAIWSGTWPGVEECRELGWYARWTLVTKYSHDGVPCEADHPHAHEALNRLAEAAACGYLRWDRERQRWVKP